MPTKDKRQTGLYSNAILKFTKNECLDKWKSFIYYLAEKISILPIDFAAKFN